MTVGALSLHLGRGRITGFVDDHALAWELAMAALTIVYVSLALLVDSGVNVLVSELLVLMAVIFFVEFTPRFWDAPSRLA